MICYIVAVITCIATVLIVIIISSSSSSSSSSRSISIVSRTIVARGYINII